MSNNISSITFGAFIPHDLKEFFTKINNVATPYICGGFVRNHIINHIHGTYFPIKDIDIEIFGIYPEEFEQWLTENKYSFQIINKSFAVYLVKIGSESYEFAFPRTEESQKKGYTDFEIFIDPFLSLQKAAERRDITINAIYVDTKNYQIVYPVSLKGVSDIQKKIITHNSEKFAEDPVRVLRIFRFCSQFNFGVADETIELCKSLKEQFQYLTEERVEAEFLKWSVTDFPEIGYEFLEKCQWIEFFPVIDGMRKVPQGIKYHPENLLVNHVCQVLSNIKLFPDITKEQKSQLVFSALLHDTGKKETTLVNEKPYIPFYQPVESDKITSYNHEIVSAEKVIQFFQSLNQNFSQENVSEIEEICRYHMMMSSTKTAKALRKLNLKLKYVSLKQLIRFMIMDKYNRNHSDGIDHLWDILDSMKSEKLVEKFIVDGNFLIKQGYKHSDIFDKEKKTLHFGKVIGLCKIAEIHNFFTLNDEIRIELIENFIDRIYGASFEEMDNWMKIQYPDSEMYY